MKVLSKWSFLPLLVIFIFAGCQKDWESHNEITDDRLNKMLNERIKEIPNLSRFSELITKAGMDSVLSSSKTFTVFAPTNNALSTLDPTIENDLTRLRAFVSNHITRQSFVTTRIQDTIRIEMLSLKYQNMLGKKIDVANITEADQLAKNGVLQIIDRMLPVLPNCWEAMSMSTFPTNQASFLNKLNYTGFDPESAEVIGIDPNTGLPIYKPGTGAIPSNYYWDRVYDLRKEAEEFTFFAVENTGLDTEISKYRNYFNTGISGATDSITTFQILRDFSFPGKMEQTTLPDTLVTKFGAKVGIDKSKILRSITCSNGIIYVMSELPVTPASKFTSRIIQAEEYVSTSLDRRNNTFFRDRLNPVSGMNYRDVLVQNHGVAMFNLRYVQTEMPAMKYRAYWVAVNDFQTATFSQRLSIGVPTGTNLPYIVVPAANYNEQLLGEFTLSNYAQSMDFFLVAANSTSNAANPVVCDYIRLEPVF